MIYLDTIIEVFIFIGNSDNGKLDTFYMNIQLIGENILKFLIMISGFYSSRKAKQLDRKFIEDFWDFDYSQNEQLNIQIDNYIKKIERI